MFHSIFNNSSLLLKRSKVSRELTNNSSLIFTQLTSAAFLMRYISLQINERCQKKCIFNSSWIPIKPNFHCDKKRKIFKLPLILDNYQLERWTVKKSFKKKMSKCQQRKSQLWKLQNIENVLKQFFQRISGSFFSRTF